MIRKLVTIAALVFALGVAAKPAPAIDFICSCDLCRAHPNLGCRPPGGGLMTSCSQYYAARC
jgi:hypothetical protein